MIEKIKQLLDSAQQITVLQADNPDADSLASALALEQILGEMGKSVDLYCGVDMPTYLRYLDGWDRVTNDLPAKSDLNIVVDASTASLFKILEEQSSYTRLAKTPCIILDHHAETDNIISFATVNLTDPQVASTGELIYKLAKDCDWQVDSTSASFIMTSILGDTQGLTNDLTTAQTYRVMADLVDLGVDRPKLEEKRREYSKMEQEIFRYKATLINRTEFFHNGQLAIVDIPNKEINTYSPLYNPNALIQFEHLQTKGVKISVSMKHYDDNRVTASIRCNTSAPIAAKLATKFGGGGHAYSSGFKVLNAKSFTEIKDICIKYVVELLNGLSQEDNHGNETL